MLNLEIKTSSGNYCPELKKRMGSSVLEHAIKVRKPYTITKQRERWTNEEHNKFLEALKLYGRAWRQIEEHIGTKTAVQIRSHAQKFFTKVIRESNEENSGETKKIEIPPPRPKRRPLHPYPRKLGVVSEPKLLANEQDNPSPTSVLSGVGSDTFGSSSASGIVSSNASPASSEQGETLLGDQDDVDHSGTTSVDDDDKYLKTADTELDLGTSESTPSREASPVEAPATTLKLFGKTVIVADTQKPLCFTVDDVEHHHEIPASTNEAPSVSLDEGRNQWKATPMFYILPSMPYIWSFCGDAESVPRCLKSEESSSFADSSIVSRVESSFADKVDAPSVSLKFRPSETSAFRSLKSTINKVSKGFMPYRRCVAEKKIDSQKMGNDNGEGQGLHLCL